MVHRKLHHWLLNKKTSISQRNIDWPIENNVAGAFYPLKAVECEPFNIVSVNNSLIIMKKGFKDFN